MLLIKKLPKKKGIYKCPKCKEEFTLNFKYKKTYKPNGLCGKCQKPLIARTHGDGYTRLYNIWKGMKQRCTNVNHPRFKDYGAKGVYVCDEWLNDYVAFKKWSLANGYNETKELDKDRLAMEKGVQKSYSPETCLWLERSDHAKNKKKLTNKEIEMIRERYKTETQTALAIQFNVSQTTIGRIVRREGITNG